jgi:hypothetical protein
MEILERKHGIYGYAFWWKLLEILGDTEGHYLDCENEVTWEFLTSVIPKDLKFFEEVLNLLATLGAIDTELWRSDRVIWSQNFVDGVSDAYRNRIVDIPKKPDLKRKKITSKGISYVRNTQRKGEESKGEESNLGTSVPCQPADAARPSRNHFSIQTVAKIWNELAPHTLSRVNLPFSRPTAKLKKLTANVNRHKDRNWWTQLISLLSQRPFLLGENDRGWKATLDFVIERSEEIMDGKYSGTKAQGLQAQRMAGPQEWLAKQEAKDGKER